MARSGGLVPRFVPRDGWLDPDFGACPVLSLRGLVGLLEACLLELVVAAQDRGGLGADPPCLDDPLLRFVGVGACGYQRCRLGDQCPPPVLCLPLLGVGAALLGEGLVLGSDTLQFVVDAQLGGFLCGRFPASGPLSELLFGLVDRPPIGLQPPAPGRRWRSVLVPPRRRCRSTVSGSGSSSAGTSASAVSAGCGQSPGTTSEAVGLQTAARIRSARFSVSSPPAATFDVRPRLIPTWRASASVFSSTTMTAWSTVRPCAEWTVDAHPSSTVGRPGVLDAGVRGRRWGRP